MAFLTDEEVGLAESKATGLTDEDVGLGEAEPTGILSPAESLILRPRPNTLVSTTAGGPPVPLASFRETMAEPAAVGEAMEERFWEPSIPLPRLPSVEETPPTAAEKLLASAAGLGPASVIGPKAPAALMRGAVNLAIGLPEFATSPGGAAVSILGPAAAGAGKAGQIINRLVAAGFSLDMLKGFGEQLSQTVKEWPQMTPDQKAVSIENMAGSLGLAGTLGLGAVRGHRAPPIRPETVEKPPIVPPPRIADTMMAEEAARTKAESAARPTPSDFVPEPEPMETVVKAGEMEAPVKPWNEPLFYGDVGGKVEVDVPVSKFGDYGKATYVTPDPEFAKQFAQGTAFSSKVEGSGKIHPVTIPKLEKVFARDDTPLTKEEVSHWSDDGFDMRDVKTRKDLIDEYGGRSVVEEDLRDQSEAWDDFLTKFGYDSVFDGKQLAIRFGGVKVNPIQSPTPAVTVPKPPEARAAEPATPAPATVETAGGILPEKPAAPAAQPEGEQHAQVKKPETGQIPPKPSEPTEPKPEVQAETRTPQRGGQGEASKVTLPKPKPIDYQDRNKVPGEHYRAKPNSIVIQFRGLDTEPLRTGKPFEFPFTGDMKKAGATIMNAFRQARDQGLDFSYRETPVIATDSQGNAIYHFKVNPAEGTVSATSHAEIVEARRQYREMTSGKPEEPAPIKPEPKALPEPSQPSSKMQAEVSKVAKSEGTRPAKEIKTELVQTLEKAVEDAPYEAEVLKDATVEIPSGQFVSGKPITRTEPLAEHAHDLNKFGKPMFQKEYLAALNKYCKKVTYNIPGDGDFTVWNTKEALQTVLEKAKRLSTSTAPPKGYTERQGPGPAERKAMVEEARVEPPTPPADEPATKPTPAEPVTGLTDAESSRLAELTDKLESGKALTAAERKRYHDLKNKSQPPEPEQGGVEAGPSEPSQSVGAAMPSNIGTKAQIEQLADAFAAKASARERAAAFVRNAFNFGSKGAVLKDAVSKAVAGLKESGQAVWDSMAKFKTPDELLKAKGDLSAELEMRGWRTREFVRNVQKAVPDVRRRAAIAKWIDAGGDDAVLATGEAATKPAYKQAYRDARNLTPTEKIQAQNIANYFESRLQEAIDAGVLEHGLTDYIHRIYERDPALQKRALAYVQSGILSKNPALAKKRFFQFDWEAEQAGFHPVQDFLPRVAAYEASLSKAIAARKFVQRMTQMTAPDGRPVVGIKGVGVPIEDPATGAREGTIIKPMGDFRKNQDATDPLNYRGDYENREYPSLSRWKWVASDAVGKPIFVQGDVAVHPDYVGRVDALLEPSKIRGGMFPKAGKLALGLSSTVKQTMLDLSMFHQVQIAVHGLEHRVWPLPGRAPGFAKIIQDIDFENPDVQGLLKGGVTLGGDFYGANLGEGLIGRSLTRHIPGLGAVMESYHSWLFQDFIPRVKMTMALHALERNKARYAKDIASGRMTPEALNLLTAKQANAAFGELNYTMLERSKTKQDMARLIMLAPDFLEARSRFVGQAFTKYGTEQRVALLLGAVTMWTLARVMNKVLDDQYHDEPENLFSVVYKGNSYGLRTVQGDVLHMLTKPIQFWLNRLNPVYTRTLLEAITQRDQFGRKRDWMGVAKDAVSTVIPIALRSNREKHLWESLLNATGVTARRYNDVKDAHALAEKWKKENNVREPPGEFIYDSEKDPLRPLKIALSEGDDADAVKALKSVLDSKVMSLYQVTQYFNRYASAPFSGSVANERRFMSSLSQDQLKTVQAAQQHRKAMLDTYRKALNQIRGAYVR